MSDVVIRVEDLGKRYRLGQRQPFYYRTLRDNLVKRFRKGAGETRRSILKGKGNNSEAPENRDHEWIWALKDVNFDVKQGEVVGIIGRNGSGKSTLLKILSRITAPTEGRVEILGRVGSLLEVGTGFHPELTGRENIYLNGAILGMRKAEINRKLDEIVAFAELEKFIDTPVKRYSSGMYVRLAFAVAAHLEPEILLVDEVLAVGDAAFQKKCLGKMGDVSKIGRTVLFVSHNMGAIREIALRGIWIDAGKIIYNGNIRDTIEKYLSSGKPLNHATADLSNHPNRLPRMKPILKRVSCKLSDHIPCTDFSQSDDIILEVEYNAPDNINLAGAGFIINTVDGVRVGGFNTYMAHPPPHKLPRNGKVTFVIPAREFTPGPYLVTISLGSHSGVLEDKVESPICFSVHSADIYETGYLLTREDGVAALDVKTYIESK